MINNLVYNDYGECFGAYHNWDAGFMRVEVNEAWNCMSAPYHATGQQVMYRWNLGGYYDPGGDKVEKHWFHATGATATWPDCDGTGKSGLMPVYDNSQYAKLTEYPIIGNLLFGQWTDNLSWNTGPSHSINNANTTTFNIWWINNTVVDAVINYRIYEQLTDDNENSHQYFNSSAFYGATTPLNDNDYYYCYTRDPYSTNDTKWNNWGSSTEGVYNCYSAGNDVIGDPDLEEQDASDWLFPPDMNTITWKSFRPLPGSLLIDQSEQSAYTALVDTSDPCNGVAPCSSVIVTEDKFFWEGDYITIANPANMSGTRTNTARIAADGINRGTNTLTLESSIMINDDWYVILNPYKWTSKQQDTTTGWYGARPDWGAIEYAGDDEPTLTDEPLYQNPNNITLVISSRNVQTGVSDAHDRTDWIVCTDGSDLTSCLNSIVWSSYDDAGNLLSKTIPSGQLDAGTSYYWTSRTHNEWPYKGGWNSTLDEFSTTSNYYVRPAGGSYGIEDGSSYDNAWNGFSNIDWGAIDPGSTLFVVGTHREQLDVGASGISGNLINIVSCTTENSCNP
jgi:hypothetical protein